MASSRSNACRGQGSAYPRQLDKKDRNQRNTRAADSQAGAAAGELRRWAQFAIEDVQNRGEVAPWA